MQGRSWYITYNSPLRLSRGATAAGGKEIFLGCSKSPESERPGLLATILEGSSYGIAAGGPQHRIADVECPKGTAHEGGHEGTV